MSANSKDFPYELFRKMHQDLQKQMIRITQSSQHEPPATTIPKPTALVQHRNPEPAANAQPIMQSKKPAEKMTFEQAYRDAVERLNAAAMNKQTLTNRQSSSANSPRIVAQQNTSGKSNQDAAGTSTSYSGQPPSSQGQYKTTVYNINTYNLAEMLKSQRSVAASQSAKTIANSTNNSSQSSMLSQSSAARVLAESQEYRLTFSNAYANHLLELTKTAVEKKTGPILSQPSSTGETQQGLLSNTGQPKTFSQSAASISSPGNAVKKVKKGSSLVSSVVNGKDGATLTYADVAKSASNGTVQVKTEPKTNTKKLPKLNSLEALIAEQSIKSNIKGSKVSEPRLKPSDIKVSSEEIYRRIQNQITQQVKTPTTSSTVTPSQKRPAPDLLKVQAPNQTSSTSSFPIPDLGNRPDLTVIINKPRISSPAPAHVYGKPSISGQGGLPPSTPDILFSREKIFKADLATPKRNTLVNNTTFAEPPPAHSAGSGSKSPFMVQLINQQSPNYSPSTSSDKSPVIRTPNSSISITPKSTTTSPSSAGVVPSPPFNIAHYNATANTLPSSFAERGLQTPSQYRTAAVSSSQKIVKIEKRVNYDTSRPNNDVSTPKYQQNVVWKEQPPKSEAQQNGMGNINEQKKKLLELLHNANLNQFSQSQANLQKDGRTPVRTANMSHSANSAQSINTAAARSSTNNSNKINLELHRYRMAGLNSTDKDPLMRTKDVLKSQSKIESVKRKDPPNRLQAARRKKPKLTHSTEPFLQHGPCYEVASRLPRCRECNRSAAARSKDSENIFCRFIAFRKLKYNDSHHLEVVGFANPHLDAQEVDTKLWNANLAKVPIDLTVEKSKFLLGQVGYKFCELFHQEKEAYFVHMSEDKTIAWKQAVQGVREMCDVCSTTLFNYHWVCSTCGFVACIDCYKGRKYGTSTKNDTGTRDRDSYLWLHCTTREPHIQEKLMLTQMIPSNCLYKLVRQMHGICALLEIPLNCECPLSNEPLFRKIKETLEFIYPITVDVAKKDEDREQTDGSTSLVPATPGIATTKMISITIKSIESKLSNIDNGTICCRVLFGRALSADKTPETEMLKRREKQSYSFEGFQEDIKIESLDDFIKEDTDSETDNETKTEEKSTCDEQIQEKEGILSPESKEEKQHILSPESKEEKKDVLSPQSKDEKQCILSHESKEEKRDVLCESEDQKMKTEIADEQTAAPDKPAEQHIEDEVMKENISAVKNTDETKHINAVKDTDVVTSDREAKLEMDKSNEIIADGKSDEEVKCDDRDPLEITPANEATKKTKADKNDKDNDKHEEEPFNDDYRFKDSPKLDWKTFNMIVKQLLKFDRSINISGLFEKHLTEKKSESESLVDFTADIEINHSNIQAFLNDFLNTFVLLGKDISDNLTDDVQVLEYNKYMKKGIEFQNKGERIMDLKDSEKLYPNVPHQWLCHGKLLRLLDPLNDCNYTTFHDQWERGQPVMISYAAHSMDKSLWHPQSFIDDYGEEENDLINCLNGKLVKGQKMRVFWEGFEQLGLRLLDDRDRAMLLKLKDWPPGDDFAEMMPNRYENLMKCLPLAEYTRREGRLNLASRLSSFFVRPDLGPKMYSAYGSAMHPTKGTTNLHLDVSDAVNIMVYVSVPTDVDRESYIHKVVDAIDSDECDVHTRTRIREGDELPGALWHIYHARDAAKIRSLLNKIEVERGGSIKANHDPIHDQKWYLDKNLRKRLLQEYNVEGYSIVQCYGDAIFIPAGAPHQVRNLHNCVKVAEDFVSPENISYCFKLTNEFRHLTNTHSNHEDKLQIKNIIYHTVKDAISCLTNPLIMTKDKIELQ